MVPTFGQAERVLGIAGGLIGHQVFRVPSDIGFILLVRYAGNEKWNCLEKIPQNRLIPNARTRSWIHVCRYTQAQWSISQKGKPAEIEGESLCVCVCTHAFVCLFAWLVGWLAACFVVCLFGWLVGWLVGRAKYSHAFPP